VALYQNKQPYRQELPVADRMIARWVFGSAGDTVLDSSGNNHHGQLMGNSRIISDPVRGNVLNLDGNNSYVDCGQDIRFDIKMSITVSCWIKVNEYNIMDQAIVTKGETSWRLQRAKTTPSVLFACPGIESANEGDSLSATAPVDDGSWHHIAGVYDGVNVSVYVDGVLDTSMPGSGEMDINSRAVLIGKNPEFPERCWNGLIDDVRIYNLALSKEEIKTLYDDTVQQAETTEPGGTPSRSGS